MALQLSEQEKKVFAEEFLNRFVEYGFGTMPKREIEILIFHLLHNKTDALKGRSTYEISNLLKMTESKVKALKKEACLKYQPLDAQEALQSIADAFFEYRKIKPVLEGDTIEFALEDPVLKREFENAVKSLGYFVDYSFNKEIVKVKSSVFLNLFVEKFKDVRDKFEQILKEESKKDRDFQELLDQSKTVSQKIETFLSKNENKIELVLKILSVLKPF